MVIFVKRLSKLKVLRQPVPIARGGTITSDMKFAMEIAVADLNISRSSSSKCHEVSARLDEMT